MGEPRPAELVFSDKFACPICNYSLSELEPRLFSFNSPIGACPACDGLGTQEFFDPAKIVANPHLSLAGGAVRGWDRRNAYYFQLIQSLARHAKFDIEAPFESLPEQITQARAVRQRRRGDRIQVPGRQGRHGRAASTPSRASCTTSSGAIARPSR